MRFFLRVLDVRVDQEAVHLAVDVLDRDLEAVEASRLRQLDLAAKVARQVLCGILSVFEFRAKSAGWIQAGERGMAGHG